MEGGTEGGTEEGVDEGSELVVVSDKEDSHTSFS